MFVLGVDVGGTKTQCVIADEKGHVVAEGFGGGANYQICGIESAKKELRKAVTEALMQTGVIRENLSYAVLGISGADRPEDYQILIPAIKEILGNVPFRVVHDAIIGLRAGSENFKGIASICGTGAGHAGRNDKGEEVILRNLDYITGNFGGGDEVVQQALHYAFRSEEGTWKRSRLEEVIPPIFGAENMDAVCEILMHGKMTKKQKYEIPIAAFTLATEGDEVAMEILRNMGYHEGKYAAAVVKKLGMCAERIPAVLIGSLFANGNPIMVDAYMKGLQETVPRAYVSILKEPPVIGAVKMALDRIGGMV